MTVRLCGMILLLHSLFFLVLGGLLHLLSSKGLTCSLVVGMIYISS